MRRLSCIDWSRHVSIALRGHHRTSARLFAFPLGHMSNPARFSRVRRSGLERSDIVEELGQLSIKQWILAALVISVFATSVIEVGSEFSAGQPLAAMWDDMLWIAVSAGCVLYYLYERRMSSKEIDELRNSLENARGRLVEIDTHSREIANQYRAVMQKQFDAWQLSASEQDIVIGMLKGLTFREIAGLRETREKTVRQQASAVYRKAGVSSRSELTAWFFEDMLDPPTVNSGTS